MKDKTRIKKSNNSIRKKIKGYDPDIVIVEKKLEIQPSYQYRAIRSSNFLQANWHKNKFFVLKKLIKFSKNMNVLDLGTGSGNFEIIFNKRVRKIVGVDYNNEALLFLNSYLTRHNIKNVNLLQADIRKLTRSKNLPKFDLITIIDVIEHLDDSDSNKVVRSLRKLLRKGGKVCVITPNYRSLWVVIEWVLDKTNIVPKFAEAQHLSHHYRENLEKVFKNSGFNVDKIGSFNLFSFMIPNNKISRLFCSAELNFPLMFGNLIAGVFSADY